MKLERLNQKLQRGLILKMPVTSLTQTLLLDGVKSKVVRGSFLLESDSEGIGVIEDRLEEDYRVEVTRVAKGLYEFAFYRKEDENA